VPTKILHISDVHLGSDIVIRSLKSFRVWWRYADKKVTRGLGKAIRELQPDYIVLSGDLVNKAEEDTFRTAAKYLRDLFLDAGFDMKTRLFVIPGNHDVSFFPASEPNDLERLRLYREFLRILFGEKDTDQRRHRFAHLDPKGKIIFFFLDSTLKDQWPIAEGEIGSDQRDWMRAQLHAFKNQLGDEYSQYVKIAVLHHHPVAIAGTPPSGERFMQLLDAGDFLKLLDEENFQIAMHGHKHFPHTKMNTRSDASVLTIVGAGTATRRVVSDQEGQGNNFNWLVVSPEDGVLIHQLYKADLNGDFHAEGEAKRFPLFRVTPQGYTVKSIRTISNLSADGILTEQMIQDGFRVLDSHKIIQRVPLRISTPATGGKILSFRRDTDDAVEDLPVKQEQMYLGDWVLKQPLRQGSPPIKLAYTYSLTGGTAMDQKQHLAMYHAEGNEEYTSVIVTNPAESLDMEVIFPIVPKRFPAAPSPRIEHLGSVIPVDSFQIDFKYDKYANRCELHMRNPPLDHQISIVWPLPESWDIAVADPGAKPEKKDGL